MRGGLLKNSHKWFLIRLRLGLLNTLDVLIPLLLSSIIKALDVVSDVSDGPSLVRLHGLEVECDGLVLTLDSVRVNLDNILYLLMNLVCLLGGYDGVDEAREGDITQL